MFNKFSCWLIACCVSLRWSLEKWPRHQVKFSSHQYSNKAVEKRTMNNLYMRLHLVGGELDQVESMWGRTRHGSKPAASIGTSFSGKYYNHAKFTQSFECLNFRPIQFMDFSETFQGKFRLSPSRKFGILVWLLMRPLSFHQFFLR